MKRLAVSVLAILATTCFATPILQARELTLEDSLGTVPGTLSGATTRRENDLIMRAQPTTSRHSRPLSQGSRS